MNGPRHSKVFTTRKLVTAGSYSNENLAGKSAGKSFLFSTMADGFCKNALISRFESCISDVTSTNHAWVRSIFLHYLRLDSHYIGQLFVAPRTVTARGGHKSFTHIEHRAAAVGREGLVHYIPVFTGTQASFLLIYFRNFHNWPNKCSHRTKVGHKASNHTY